MSTDRARRPFLLTLPAVRVMTMALLAAIAVALPACSSARDARFAAAIERDQPPADFQLGITVQAPQSRLGARAIITPARDGQPATQTFVSNTPYGQRGVAAIPVSHRPARYVFEADWVLRSAVGYGARESNFPTQTRQLNAEQIQQLWTMLQSSGLLDAHHPAIVSTAPEPEEGMGRTAYILSYQVAGLRRTLVIDAGLPPSGESATATPSSESQPDKPESQAASGATPQAATEPDADAVRSLINTLARWSWQS